MDNLPYEYLLYIECKKKNPNNLHTIFEFSFTFSNFFYTLRIHASFLSFTMNIKRITHTLTPDTLITLHNEKDNYQRRYFEF